MQTKTIRQAPAMIIRMKPSSRLKRIFIRKEGLSSKRQVDVLLVSMERVVHKVVTWHALPVPPAQIVPRGFVFVCCSELQRSLAAVKVELQ